MLFLKWQAKFNTIYNFFGQITLRLFRNVEVYIGTRGLKTTVFEFSFVISYFLTKDLITEQEDFVVGL